MCTTDTPPPPRLTYAGVLIQDEAKGVLELGVGTPVVSRKPDAKRARSFPDADALGRDDDGAVWRRPIFILLEATDATLESRSLRLRLMGVGWSRLEPSVGAQAKTPRLGGGGGGTGSGKGLGCAGSVHQTGLSWDGKKIGRGM